MSVTIGMNLSDIGAGRLEISRSDGGVVGPEVQAPIIAVNAQEGGFAVQSMAAAVDPNFTPGQGNDGLGIEDPALTENLGFT